MLSESLCTKDVPRHLSCERVKYKSARLEPCRRYQVSSVSVAAYYGTGLKVAPHLDPSRSPSMLIHCGTSTLHNLHILKVKF